MSPSRMLLLTAMAMLAFAANSLLCRVALRDSGIDPASFTTVRIASGAVVLWLIVCLRGGNARGGSWLSSMALFAYAAGFSFAYVSLPAGLGALLLFGAVQITMIGHGLATGERLQPLQLLGFLLALAGLVGLLLPGLSAPPLLGSALMLAAGAAWGVYSVRGTGGGDPILATAGNFLRALPMTLLLSVVLWREIRLDAAGVSYAMASGALASGLGYAIWYSTLPYLRSLSAAAAQLSVPVIAAIGGVLLLGETADLRLLLSSATILGGVGLVLAGRLRRG